MAGDGSTVVAQIANVTDLVTELLLPVISEVREGPVSGSGDNTEMVLWVILGLATLMWGAWAGGTLLECVGGPALVGEIFVGMLLGPCGVPLLPVEWREVGGPLDKIGTAGLLILVYEGGLGTNLRMFKTHGFQVIMLAFTGIIMPPVFAVPVMMGFGFGGLESFAAGTVLCSTAIAFTVRLLQDNKLLKTHKGQLIIISAVIDDIISLVVLAVLNVLGQHKKSGNTSIGFGPIIRPLWTSAIIFCVALGLKFGIQLMLTDCSDECIKRYTTGFARPAFNTVACVFTLAVTYGAQKMGSTYLLGTYMAGIVFSSIPTAEDVWEESVGESIRPWFSRLFFVSTVGFAIPLGALVNSYTMLMGLVLTIAAILGKFLTGAWSASPFSKGYKLLFVQVGSAMVGRGELGFVVAKMALAMGLLTEPSFSACIWALLLATIIGPFMFQFFLRYDKPSKHSGDEAIADSTGTYGSVKGSSHDTFQSSPDI